MKIMANLILAAIKAVADLLSRWFGWEAKKEKERKDAVNKTTNGIGKGKTFIALALILTVGGCGYVYTVSTPLVFDSSDFADMDAGQAFTAPVDGVYFSDSALEIYIRSKIAEYEMRKRGFFHKEKTKTD